MKKCYYCGQVGHQCNPKDFKIKNKCCVCLKPFTRENVLPKDKKEKLQLERFKVQGNYCAKCLININQKMADNIFKNKEITLDNLWIKILS